MKKFVLPLVFAVILALIAIAVFFRSDILFKLRAMRFARVANRVVALFNAGDYSGVEALFNSEMSRQLPPERAPDFFKAISAQFGKIQKLDDPSPASDGMLFPANCERGVFDIALTLDDQNKIAGLLFKPHVDGRYLKVANRLVELVNAADYSGVEGLFDQEMSQALPPEKAAEFFQGAAAQFGKIQTLDDPEPAPEGMVFPAQCERGALDMTLALDAQGKIAGLLFKPPGDDNLQVANRLVELINAADYLGVESLFNSEMSQALPLEKASDFLAGLSAQAGQIRKLDAPEPGSDGVVFPAHCEHAVLDMTLALDAQHKIAGLLFQPHVDRYTRVANHLVELMNAADYSGIEGLFNQQMSNALPLAKATDFFTELTGQVGKIQKLDKSRRKAGWIVFPTHCERGNLDLSLALDDQNKIAGVTFRPSRAAAP